MANATIAYVNSVNQNPKAYTLNKDGKTKTFRSPISADVDPRRLGVMTREVLSSLEIQYTGRKFTEVQVGVQSHIPPRFPERSKPDSAGIDGLFITPWQPAVNVPEFCCKSITHP